MTHDEMIAVIQAEKDGKQIEKTLGRFSWEDKRRGEPFVFHEGGDGWIYRVKPTPKQVPLGPDDFPPGTVCRIASEHIESYFMITAVDPHRVYGGGADWTYEELAAGNYHKLSRRLPGSTEWLPCWRGE